MEQRKIRVAVLMGGPSSEHEVSLKSGIMVLKHLNQNKFLVLPIKIGRDGSWPLTISELKRQVDIVFIALHGFYGEDGQVQGLLDTFKIPYTGSGALASARAMDKEETSAILKNHGYRVPDYYIVNKKERPAIHWKNPKSITLPVVIKPTNSGSSVGVNIVRKEKDFSEAIMDAFKYGDSLLVQKYIPGIEMTAGVLEINGHALALPPTEIVPKQGDFFNYQSKYDAGGSLEITPPNRPKELIKKVQRQALSVHRLLGCSGMSRTDMIIGKDNKIYILELNTIPGMTTTSLLPQQAEKMGFSFPQLLEIIIDAGLAIKK